ncbi:MAG: CorA family divalent cation transporter, partial [Thermoleophilia bacterium]
MRILESIDRSTISDLLARDEFFWLDLERPSSESIGLLDELFHYHPLALEDSREFGQRPKLEDYENHIFLVYYGARPEG